MAQPVSPALASQLIRKVNGPSVGDTIGVLTKKVDDLINKFKTVEANAQPDSKKSKESRELFIQELSKTINMDDSTVSEQIELMNKIEKETTLTLGIVSTMSKSWANLAKSSFFQAISSPLAFGKYLTSSLRMGGFFLELGKSTFSFLADKLKTLTPQIIKNSFGTVMESIKSIAASVRSFMAAPFQKLFSSIKKFFDPLIQAFNVTMAFVKKLAMVLVNVIMLSLEIVVATIAFLFELTTLVVGGLFALAAAVITFTFALATTVIGFLLALTTTVIGFALALTTTVVVFALSLVSLIAISLFTLTLTVITFLFTLTLTVITLVMTFFLGAILIALELAVVAGLAALFAVTSMFIMTAILIPASLLTLSTSLATFFYLIAVITPTLAFITALCLISATGSILLIAFVLVIGYLLFKAWQYLQNLYKDLIQPAFEVVKSMVNTVIGWGKQIWDWLGNFYDNYIQPVFDWIGDWLSNFGQVVTDVWNYLLTLPAKVIEWTSAAIETTLSWLKTGWDVLYGWVQQIAEWVNPVAVAKRAAAFAKEKAGQFADAIKSGLNSVASSLYPFASGGIVTGPTRALVAEAGTPEAIIPLNKQGMDFIKGSFSLDAKALNDIVEKSKLFEMQQMTLDLVRQNYDATQDIKAVVGSELKAPVIVNINNPSIGGSYDQLEAIIVSPDGVQDDQSSDTVIIKKLDELALALKSIEIPDSKGGTTGVSEYSNFAELLAMGRIGKKR